MPTASSDGRRGPGRPPARDSALTRGNIITAAREAFGEFGYGATTFQSIATRADLTRPAINHYFPSKKALFRAVVIEANEVALKVGIAQAETEPTLQERLSTFIDIGVQASSADPALIRS